MKIKVKIIIAVISVSTIIFTLLYTVNLALNKKYFVDELSLNNTPEKLVHVYNTISSDYNNAMFLNLFLIFLVLIYTVIILSTKAVKN